MSYDAIRLETRSGDVVAYFAPTFEVTPQDQNEVFESPRGSDRPTIVRDNGLWTSELTVQGAFHHSDSVGEPLRSALQDLFGQQTVTPDDQINRLRSFTVYDDPGALHFYHRENEYRATSQSTLDIENGVYPAVSVTELRMPEDGETSTLQTDFMVRMSIGLERASGSDD